MFELVRLVLLVPKFKFTFPLEAGFLRALVKSVMKRLKRETFQMVSM